MNFPDREAQQPHGRCGERPRPQPPAPMRRRSLPCWTCCTNNSRAVHSATQNTCSAGHFRDAMGAVRRADAAQAARPARRNAAEVNIISSEGPRRVGRRARKLVNGANWHNTDDSLSMREPCSLTMLYGVVVPVDGLATPSFTKHVRCLRRTWPAETKARIDGLKVIHKYSSSRKLTHVSTRGRPRRWRRCRKRRTRWCAPHPETHRKSLYLNPNRMERIVGLEREESDPPCLDELITHATQMKYQLPATSGDKGRHRDLGQSLHDATKPMRIIPTASAGLMHRVIMAGTVPV